MLSCKLPEDRLSLNVNTFYLHLIGQPCSRSSGPHSCRGVSGRVKIHPVSNGRQGLQGQQEHHFGGVLFCYFSVVKLGLTPRHHHGLQPTSLPCPSLSPGVLLKFKVSNHLILCYPFLLLLSVFPSIRVFSSELAVHIRWPKY